MPLFDFLTPIRAEFNPIPRIFGAGVDKQRKLLEERAARRAATVENMTTTGNSNRFLDVTAKLGARGEAFVGNVSDAVRVGLYEFLSPDRSEVNSTAIGAFVSDVLYRTGSTKAGAGWAGLAATVLYRISRSGLRQAVSLDPFDGIPDPPNIPPPTLPQNAEMLPLVDPPTDGTLFNASAVEKFINWGNRAVKAAQPKQRHEGHITSEENARRKQAYQQSLRDDLGRANERHANDLIPISGEQLAYAARYAFGSAFADIRHVGFLLTEKSGASKIVEYGSTALAFAVKVRLLGWKKAFAAAAAGELAFALSRERLNAFLAFSEEEQIPNIALSDHLFQFVDP